MQKENSIVKKESPNTKIFDIDTKKEIAKIGMTASLGTLVATSFYLKTRAMKNLHLASGVAMVGFSLWHHFLYQPDKNPKK